MKKTIADIGYAKDSHKIIMEGEIKTKVYGDESRIEQVITNLITNSIKYSPHADKVVIRLDTDKNNAIVSVEDFGFGIEKEDQLKIFDRFYRTGTDKEMNVEGFGLGLYISSEIVKAHGGNMWVESEKNKGSTFYFTLPF